MSSGNTTQNTGVGTIATRCSLTFPRKYDEFGVPATTNTPDRYGWLGSKQRATSQPSEAMLMGQRVYLPTTGRFLQSDPVEGGSANDYDYANADPVNALDLTGERPECVFSNIGFLGRATYEHGSTVVSLVPIVSGECAHHKTPLRLHVRLERATIGVSSRRSHVFDHFPGKGFGPTHFNPCHGSCSRTGEASVRTLTPPLCAGAPYLISADLLAIREYTYRGHRRRQSKRVTATRTIFGKDPDC